MKLHEGSGPRRPARSCIWLRAERLPKPPRLAARRMADTPAALRAMYHTPPHPPQVGEPIVPSCGGLGGLSRIGAGVTASMGPPPCVVFSSSLTLCVASVAALATGADQLAGQRQLRGHAGGRLLDAGEQPAGLDLDGWAGHRPRCATTWLAPRRMAATTWSWTPTATPASGWT